MQRRGWQQIAPPAHAGRPSRPFVGREQELAELASVLEEGASGRGSLVLVTGEPGIGKTRLTAELAGLGARRGVCVATGRCWEQGGAPPYWPWLQVVRARGGDLEELVAGTGPPAPQRAPPTAVPEGERLRLFDAVGRLLAAASSERPILVVIDDLHAADEPSLLLLRFLGEALADARILLVASYREAEKRVRERSELFAELARVGSRIALRGLTPADIEAYVATATGVTVSGQAVARLHEVTGGNPYFLEEVVRLLAAGDALDSLDDPGKDPLLRVPDEVRTLIRRRVAGLPRDAVSALRLAAVIGREFDLRLLESASRLTTARLMTVLAEAAAVGLVAGVSATPLRYSFVHDLVRETLYDDLPPRRRLELHLAVGRLLEAVHGDDLDPYLSEIARHLFIAAPLGGADQAVEYLVRAGDRASAVLGYEDAAVHYRHALELLATPRSGTRHGRGDLLLRLGDAQWRSGDGSAARLTFERAIDAGRRTGDPEVLARAALGSLTALGFPLLYSRFQVGGPVVALLDEALAALPAGDSSLRARLLARLALEVGSGNEPVERRVAISEQAIAMARRVGDSEALVAALHSRQGALTTPGRAPERLAHTEEMLRVAKETVNPELEFLAHNARLHCFLEVCDRWGMETETQAMATIAEQMRQPFYRWHTVCLRALAATLDGRFADAERLAHEALELGRLRQSEYPAYVFPYAQMLAIRWAQGRLAELWPEIDDHGERFPWIPRWREALAAAELGDEEAARRELERHAVRGFAELPRDGLWILHLSSLAEACVLVGDERRGLRLYELLLPHAGDNAVAYTLQPFGPVALRLGMLAALLERWGDADRHFATALRRCEDLSARAIRARVLLEHARALTARGEGGDRERIAAMLEEAAGLCEELGMTGLLERVSALRGHRAAAPPAADAVFRREGEFWTIAYRGQVVRLRDVKGLRYIAVLLASPGRDVHVLELVSAAAGRPADARARLAADDVVASAPSDLDPLLDEQAKKEYGRRLVELEEELEQVRDWGDTERAIRLEGELDLLNRELARALGLRGRDRTFSSPAERARISVTKAIKTAIRLIDKQCPELAAHLEASIQTGRSCSYVTRGAPPPSWSL
jgi:AAA ATPase domain